MKPVIILSLFIVSSILCSCTPDNKDIFNVEEAKVLASISNNTENIALGDTLTIHLRVPDSIQTSSGVKVIESLQRCQFGMTISKMDTVTRIARAIRQPFVWVSKGTMEGNLSFASNTNQRPFETIIHVKPQERGLYYVEIINQPGQLKINNNYETRLIVNFNVPNKHFNILSIVVPYFGGQPIYDAIFQRDIDGFGAYFFRVI